MTLINILGNNLKKAIKFGNAKNPYEIKEHWENLLEMNEEMKNVRRKFRYKNAKSEINSGECYVRQIA